MRRRRLTMRLTWRDGVAVGLVGAIVVPYAGWLALGEVPLVHSGRAVAVVGLGLGFVAHAVIARGDHLQGAGLSAAWAAVASLLAGFNALLFADFAAGPFVLALFMGSILVSLALELDAHSNGRIQGRFAHKARG
jgi:hypothetical protein